MHPGSTPRSGVPLARASTRGLRRLLTGAIAGLACTTAWLATAAELERVLDKPCRALALDVEPHWAALGDASVAVQDKRGVHEETLPPALQGAGQELGVFFGRDYRVRVAGTARTARGAEARYYRALPGGLRPAPDELGPLGKAGAPGLFTLLGTADPEIVCRPGISCLIKRISGWSKASVPAGLSRVGLSLGTGWALAGSSLYRLEKDWVLVGQASQATLWQTADDALIRGERACVVERKADRMHHFDGESWQSSKSPVSGPRSLWASPTSLWVAGDGGAKVYRNGAWAALPSSVGAVAQVLGRGDGDVWFCGAQGVFRSRG